MPADGGNPTRLTMNGGSMPVESPDGKSVFYANQDVKSGIWKIPVDGGEAEYMTGPIAKDPAFVPSKDGIYYAAPPESSTRQFIHFLEFSTGRSRPVVVAEREIGVGMSLSPDGRYLIFPLRDQVGSDLMLIRNFDITR
jgi:Tol biopolymer transport system component